MDRTIYLIIMKLSVILILVMVFLAALVSGDEVSFRIASGEDDGFEKNSILNLSSVIVDLGLGSMGAFRFQLNINSSAEIEEAHLVLRYNWGRGPSLFFITIEDAMSSSIINSGFSNKKKSGMRVVWFIQEVSGVYGDPYQSPNLAHFIKGTISNKNWKSGNYITFYLHNFMPASTSRFEVVSYEGSQSTPRYNGPELILRGRNLSRISEETYLTPLLNKFQNCKVKEEGNNTLKKPIVLVIDDLQARYLEEVSIEIVEVNIKNNIDILLNVIPNDIQNSVLLKDKLHEWFRDQQCLIEIGQHGYTHQGSEYSMPSLGREGQAQIMRKGQESLEAIGISVRSFTPPGGAQNDLTLQLMSEMGFTTNIDWWVNLNQNHGITVLKAIRLCNLELGTELGPTCVFKKKQEIFSEIKAFSDERGYTCIGFHVQDFIKEDTSIDWDKFRIYKDLLTSLKAMDEYIFMTPQEFTKWRD